ncbi:uncharacterized protein LOC134572384 [Pelobates fuscus]|uniref:uncharacterized protein LOC134572384 n=1 Tax=Pelobates fuscus TaxID=191477 RepID=UPI002FE47D4C
MVHDAAPGASGTRGLAGRVAWMVGHSFVFWAERRAAARAQGHQLGFHRDQLAVQWFGYRDFCWGEVCGMVFRMVAGGQRPDLLVLHAGGNDLGLTPQRRLVKWMKQDLNSLRDLLPGVMLVWSEIVPRRRWRHARDPEAIDRCRKKVNSLMASFVRKLGGVVVRHSELEGGLPGYYRSDGVHLSAVGWDLLTLGWQDGITKALCLRGGGAQTV